MLTRALQLSHDAMHRANTAHSTTSKYMTALVFALSSEVILSAPESFFSMRSALDGTIYPAFHRSSMLYVIPNVFECKMPFASSLTKYCGM